MLILSAAAACVVAGVWSTVQGGGFQSMAGIALMVIAGLMSLTGGTFHSRAETLETRAFFGMGPEFEEPAAGEGLTGLGVFLLVSVPLFIVGGLLAGSG